MLRDVLLNDLIGILVLCKQWICKLIIEVESTQRTRFIHVQPAADTFIMEVMQRIAGQHDNLFLHDILHSADSTFRVTLHFTFSIFDTFEFLEEPVPMRFELAALENHVRQRDDYRDWEDYLFRKQ